MREERQIDSGSANALALADNAEVNREVAEVNLGLAHGGNSTRWSPFQCSQLKAGRIAQQTSC